MGKGGEVEGNDAVPGNVAANGGAWIKNDQRTRNALFRTGGLEVGSKETNKGIGKINKMQQRKQIN